MKPKILVIASYAKSLINFRLHMMQAFIRKGYEVYTCAPADEEVATTLAQHDIRFIAINLKRTGLNPFHDFAYLIALKKIIKQVKPLIVFSYTIKPVIYGSIVARFAGVKHIFSMITGMGYAFSDMNYKSKIVGFIAKSLFKHTLKFNQKIFFQNEDNLQTFLDHRLIKNRDQGVLINGSGVDVTAFTPAPYTDKTTFLMIARLLKDKGVSEYLKAAQAVKDRYPDTEFLLVGWFDDNPNSVTHTELQEYIDANVITFLGKLSDVRPALARASVFVLPSYAEGTPRTVLEAMAMARPIITTDVPGCRQTVVVNKNGFLVPPKEVDGLINAMSNFINNPSLISTMGRASRQIAMQKYDVNKVNEQILKYVFPSI